MPVDLGQLGDDVLGGLGVNVGALQSGDIKQILAELR